MTEQPDPAATSFRKALGPGILFAGAAIGVSHLVQSTTAGAVYGLALVPLVLMSHLFKYPAMVFGPRYAAATGRSLPDAYREQGWLSWTVFAAITLGTMFTIQAAVTIVTAALVGTYLLEPILGEAPQLWVTSAGLLAVAAALNCIGGYGLLDRLLKILMVILLVSTIWAAASQAPAVLRSFDEVRVAPWVTDPAWILFAVALVGWMPAPLDITAWNSLWTLERARQTGSTPTRKHSELDFRIGYGLCVVTAVSFVVLGAGVLYLNGEAPAEGAGPFATQLVGLYSDSMGDWARPLIVTCAIAVMLSTTLTVFDAIPRTCAAIAGAAAPRRLGTERMRRPLYWLFLVLVGVGAVALIGLFAGKNQFRALVNLATTLSFLGTPVIAWLNHRAITSPAVPEQDRPGRGLRVFSLVCVGVWSAFAAYYLWTLVADTVPS
ncbi:MAG: divalent metal cation transporter [Planctomycetota bacterium]